MERDDTPVIVERVVGEYIDVSSWWWHRKGTNDYSSDRIDILKIVDGEGKGYEGVWEKGWTGLFPVVETREGDGGRVVRIHRRVCPVPVLMLYFYEYVSYDHSEHCSQHASHSWVCYER